MAEYELTDEIKSKIDAMDLYDMCRIWRFGGNEYQCTMGAIGVYFKKRLFYDLGGFTPEISKSLGW